MGTGWGHDHYFPLSIPLLVSFPTVVQSSYTTQPTAYFLFDSHGKQAGAMVRADSQRHIKLIHDIIMGEESSIQIIIMIREREVFLLYLSRVDEDPSCHMDLFLSDFMISVRFQFFRVEFYRFVGLYFNDLDRNLWFCKTSSVDRIYSYNIFGLISIFSVPFPFS